ncbi:MAG TPA: hypothetical protein VFL80_10485 [Thermoanaerobaculia bacterium]|nr:hypothetical protein [Thermoanaerobaculia bacterium]
MKKAVFLLMFLTVLAASAAQAQDAEFGILFGGSKAVGTSGDFSLSNSVRELYYAAPLDPITRFKIKAGRISAPALITVEEAGQPPRLVEIEDAEVEHIDGIIEYRFDEPFGSAGLFVGAGLYRQKAEVSGQDEESRSNWGYSGGVTGDFPLNRRLGVVFDGTYHWTRLEGRPRYLTLAAGLRISF